MRTKKIFITGGCGFIGCNLVRYLLDRGGFDLTVYDNLSSSSKNNLDKAVKASSRQDLVRFIEGDILDESKLNNSISGHDTIVHLAAHTSVLESLEDPRKSLTENTIGTFNCLEAARNNKVKRFIFASSNAVIGKETPPINENMIPRPFSAFRIKGNDKIKLKTVIFS